MGGLAALPGLSPRTPTEGENIVARRVNLSKLKLLSIALAILGVLAATLLVGWFGFGKITQAIFSVGFAGFAVYAASQVALFVLLGLAWWAVAPAGNVRLPVMVWGRMVRDSAASCLPFSQLGGFVLGTRAITLHGVSAHAAIISTVVDLTDEFVAEILFTLVGFIILLTHGSGLHGDGIAIGIAVSLLASVVALRMQSRIAPLLGRLGKRMLDQFSLGAARPGESEHELNAIYGQTGRIALGTGLHLLGWFGKGASSWIAYRLLGADIDLGGALAIEALLHAILAVAFLVPGYAGIQEIGYTGLGAIFGVTPEISISVSLLRRARDIALGVPILLFWQFVEMRQFRRKVAKV
jgi:putative membrane protein